jgi:uncharacterized SAM-binding protein YcdF (DUF218 family)
MRAALADPVFLVLAMGIIGLIAGLRWRWIGALIGLLSLLVLYGLSTEYVSSRLLEAAEPAPTGQTATDPAHPPGAIVVLSGGLRKSPPEQGGDMIGEDTLERVRRAAQLWRETHLPVLVSGGPVPGSAKTLARTMTESLQRDFGITDVREEDRSETTYENAKYSARILNAAGIGSIYLVTHAAHMPRAAEAFKHSGLRVVPAPTGFTRPVESLTAYSLAPRADFLDGPFANCSGCGSIASSTLRVNLHRRLGRRRCRRSRWRRML